MAQIEYDDDGYPIMLAAAPGQVAEQPPSSGFTIHRGAASGNPHADPVTGKFAHKDGKRPPANMNGKVGAGETATLHITKGAGLYEKLHESSRNYLHGQAASLGAQHASLQPNGSEADATLWREHTPVASFTLATTGSDKKTIEAQQKQAAPPLPSTRMSVPPGVDPAEWERRVIAVRDAARQHIEFGFGDAKDFLRGRVPDHNAVDIPQFVTDVRHHQLDDLADVLDNNVRKKVDGMFRSRAVVRVAAPKGWTQRMFNGLDNNEVMSVVKRLQTRGWSNQDLSNHVLSRIGDETRRAQLERALTGEGA